MNGENLKEFLHGFLLKHGVSRPNSTPKASPMMYTTLSISVLHPYFVINTVITTSTMNATTLADIWLQPNRNRKFQVVLLVSLHSNNEMVRPIVHVAMALTSAIMKMSYCTLDKVEPIVGAKVGGEAWLLEL